MGKARITVKNSGSFEHTRTLLLSGMGKPNKATLEKIGNDAIDALKEVTPVRTGLTRASWYYTIEYTKHGASIIFANSNVQSNGNVALLLDVGHSTASGVWIEGLDYIEPALKPVFEDAKERLLKEMTYDGKQRRRT